MFCREFGTAHAKGKVIHVGVIRYMHVIFHADWLYVFVMLYMCVLQSYQGSCHNLY